MHSVRRGLALLSILWALGCAYLASGAAVQSFEEYEHSLLRTSPDAEPAVHVGVSETSLNKDVIPTSRTGILGKIEGKMRGEVSKLLESSKGNETNAAVTNGVKATTNTTNEKSVEVENGSMWNSSIRVHENGGTSGKEAASGRKLGVSLSEIFKGLAEKFGNMSNSFGQALFHRKENEYKISSQNDSMIIAEISGKRLTTGGDGSSRVSPLSVVFRWKKLMIEVDEIVYREDKDDNGELKEESASNVALYKIPIKDGGVKVNGVYLRTKRGVAAGYEIVIPLESTESAGGVTRTGVEEGTVDEKNTTHWGTHREEDEYEFLHAQMGCQKLHGLSGMRRMICTCEKVHTNDMTKRMLCMSRVAEKIAKAATFVGEEKIAKKVSFGSLRCKRGWRRKAEKIVECIGGLLRRTAEEESELHKGHSRSILSKSWDTEMGVDDLLASEKLRAEDFMEMDEEEGLEEMESGRRGVALMRVYMFVAYVIGVGLLVVCLYDVTKQYRMHKEQSRRATDLSRLPLHAQTLYSHLISRM